MIYITNHHFILNLNSCLSIMSDLCVVAQILNPHPAKRGCGLKLSHALISNILKQTLDFMDRHYLHVCMGVIILTD